MPLNKRDKWWFGLSIKFCDELGLFVSSDFKFTPVNYVNGDDILDPNFRLSTDLLIACYILDDLKIERNFRCGVKKPHGKPFASLADYRRWIMQGDDPSRPDYKTSPRQTPTAWREAARRLGAKVVVAFSNDHEINVDSFLSPEYPLCDARKVQLPTSEGWEEFDMDIILRKDLADRWMKRKQPVAEPS